MRTENFFTDECDDENIDDVRALAPWAAEIVAVDGGWIAFESSADAAAWSEQA